MAIEKRNTSGSLLDACDAAPAYVTDEQLERWNRVCESNGRQPTRDAPPPRGRGPPRTAALQQQIDEREYRRRR